MKAADNQSRPTEEQQQIVNAAMDIFRQRSNSEKLSKYREFAKDLRKAMQDAAHLRLFLKAMGEILCDEDLGDDVSEFMGIMAFDIGNGSDALPKEWEGFFGHGDD